MQDEYILTDDLPELLNTFVADALHEFKYLEGFGFSYDRTETGTSWASVLFRKGELIVEVTYSSLDQWIAVDIRNFQNGALPEGVAIGTTASLINLVGYYAPEIPVVDQLFVRSGRYEVALKTAASLLEKYGQNILRKQA